MITHGILWLSGAVVITAPASVLQDIDRVQQGWRVVLARRRGFCRTWHSVGISVKAEYK